MFKATKQGQHRYSADADWGVLDGAHIGAAWRIRLNSPCQASMRPYVTLVDPLFNFSGYFFSDE